MRAMWLDESASKAAGEMLPLGSLLADGSLAKGRRWRCFSPFPLSYGIVITDDHSLLITVATDQQEMHCLGIGIKVKDRALFF